MCIIPNPQDFTWRGGEEEEDQNAVDHSQRCTEYTPTILLHSQGPPLPPPLFLPGEQVVKMMSKSANTKRTLVN